MWDRLSPRLENPPKHTKTHQKHLKQTKNHLKTAQTAQKRFEHQQKPTKTQTPTSTSPRPKRSRSFAQTEKQLANALRKCDVLHFKQGVGVLGLNRHENKPLLGLSWSNSKMCFWRFVLDPKGPKNNILHHRGLQTQHRFTYLTPCW